MILIINICNNEMHYYEFVKPVEDILKKSETSFDTVHYSKIKIPNPKSASAQKFLSKYHRIIIAGTSLKDMSYSRKIGSFKFLKDVDKPILGICGGMQILCMINGCRLEKNMEIGLMKLDFNAEYLGIKGNREIYSLHNMSVKNDVTFKKNFKVYSKSSSGCIQAVKSIHHKHYGVLFHPEVRNKDIIDNFLSA